MSTEYLNSINNLHHEISIPKAAELIRRYDTERPRILAGDFLNADPFTKSQTFEKSQVQALLNQTGCVGLRAYFGMYDHDPSVPADRQGKIVLVLCGVDENGDDLNLLPGDPASGQIILQEGQLCPPFCKAHSQINNL